jgi:hypothetical protein
VDAVRRWSNGASGTLAALAVNGLAAYRITRLLQRDSLPPLPALREKLTDRYGHLPVADLIDCPWCLGFWVSAGVVAAASSPARRVWSPLAAALALSAVVGLVSTHTHD